MKKLGVLFVSVSGLFLLSGCTTKYIHKCDKKNGVCVESLYTNSSNVAKNIKLTVDNANGCCGMNPPVKYVKPIKKASKDVNINIIIKKGTQKAKDCMINSTSPIEPCVDTY